MFGRQITMKLKANSAKELTRINENEIIPLLRKHKGFRDETTFIAPERSEAIANSFWDSKEDADAYSRVGYAEVLKTLSNLLEGKLSIVSRHLTLARYRLLRPIMCLRPLPCVETALKPDTFFRLPLICRISLVAHAGRRREKILNARMISAPSSNR